MYPILQKENDKYKIIGKSVAPQRSCFDEDEQNKIKEKKDRGEKLSKQEESILLLKPLKRLNNFVMENGKEYFYEDGEIKEI